MSEPSWEEKVEEVIQDTYKSIKALAIEIRALEIILSKKGITTAEELKEALMQAEVSYQGFVLKEQGRD